MEETVVKDIRGLNLSSFIQIVKKASPSKWLIILAVIISVIKTVIGLMIPLMTKTLVDQLSTEMLNPETIILFIALFILEAVTAGLSIYLLTYIGETVVANIRRRLWGKILSLRITYFDSSRTGEIISRLTNDTAILKNLITNHLVSAFTGIISVIGAIFILVFIDWQMTLVMLSIVPILILVVIPLGRKMYRISKSTQEEMANLTNVLTQVISEIRLVKASVAEAREKDLGEKKVKSLFQYGLKEAKVQAVLNPIITLALMLTLVLIIGYGGVRVSAGALSAGELVAFLLYLFLIVVPVSQFASFFTRVQKGMGATERINDILKEAEESDKQIEKLENTNDFLMFNNVSFSYEKGESILNNVNFSIPPGKVTAIVGPSGAGKTTIFAMLERFYKPQQGNITLGVTPIEHFSLKEWRTKIGYVSQESPIMAGTIKENICYGLDEQVNNNMVKEAARMAYADQFIDQLPKQYETEVGERGIKLSGGQRQRIAIARALLRDPNILMLDEATSNLDSTSERVVQEALSNLMCGRTTVVVAHRLSTVINADQIVVLEKGKVTGTGNHEELLKTHLLYQKLVEQQFKFE